MRPRRGAVLPFISNDPDVSVAAPRSEGLHSTRRHASVCQAYSEYTHYCPRRAAGMAGVLPRYRGPSWCSYYWPLDQSATIGTLCTDPSRMRPSRQSSPGHSTPRNAMSGRDKPACGRERCHTARRAFCPLGNFPPSRSWSNIHTAVVVSQAGTVGDGSIPDDVAWIRRLA